MCESERDFSMSEELKPCRRWSCASSSRRAFDSPLRHSLIEDVLYGRFDEACESLEAWIAKAEKEAENANH